MVLVIEIFLFLVDFEGYLLVRREFFFLRIVKGRGFSKSVYIVYFRFLDIATGLGMGSWFVVGYLDVFFIRIWCRG